MSPRRGRRSGRVNTKDEILAAARASFASAGYDGTSLRAIARAAGVDPALVSHYYGSKDRLFAAVMQLPVDLPEAVGVLLVDGLPGLGERLARFFLGLWEDPVAGQPLLGLMRSAVSNEQAAATMRSYVGDALLGPIVAALEAPDRRLRVTLVGSQLVGLAMLRYVVRVEPLASTDVDTAVAWLSPTLDRYLTAATALP